MKDIINFIISIILLIAVAAALVIGAVTYLRWEEEKDWNNGYCECGGHWVYEQVVGHAYSTSYLYRCDECGKTNELWKYHPVSEAENGS